MNVNSQWKHQTIEVVFRPSSKELHEQKTSRYRESKRRWVVLDVEVPMLKSARLRKKWV